MEGGLGRRQAASRRKALVFAASVAALTYYAHRRRWASRARAAVTPLALAVAAYRDAALTSGRLCAALVGDLSAFLNSTDAHAEVPTSLRQLLRLATCNEAQAAVSTLGRSLTDGLASGVAAAVQAPSGGRALLENALDAASTEQGRSLLACVVSAAARQAVAVALEASERTAAHAPGPDSDTLDRVLGELDTDRGRRVAQGASTQASVLVGSRAHARVWVQKKRAAHATLCSVPPCTSAPLTRSPVSPGAHCRRDWSPGQRCSVHLPLLHG